MSPQHGVAVIVSLVTGQFFVPKSYIQSSNYPWRSSRRVRKISGIDPQSEPVCNLVIEIIDNLINWTIKRPFSLRPSAIRILPGHQLDCRRIPDGQSGVGTLSRFGQFRQRWISPCGPAPFPRQASLYLQHMKNCIYTDFVIVLPVSYRSCSCCGSWASMSWSSFYYWTCHCYTSTCIFPDNIGPRLRKAVSVRTSPNLHDLILCLGRSDRWQQPWAKAVAIKSWLSRAPLRAQKVTRPIKRLSAAFLCDIFKLESHHFRR